MLTNNNIIFLGLFLGFEHSVELRSLLALLETRVRPIPGMSRYTDTDTRYRYLYEKNRYESVMVSV